MRIAVLSDVHGLAKTYEAALLAARAEGFDHLVVLGDLLTYGVEPSRTIDITLQAVSRDGAILILGNHDQLYLDRRMGHSAYVDALPDWIRESIDWTCEQTDGALALAGFAWKREWVVGPLLIAHANPFAYGDWRYLSTPDQMAEACAAVADRRLRWGLFGHTHRFRRFEQGDASLVTVGSLGQPRDRDDGSAQWAMVNLSPNGIDIRQRRVPFDRKAHRQAIGSTRLSPSTKERLCEFFP